MPTWLATPKMPPELRARVEASVRGGAKSLAHRLSPRHVMSLRLLAVGVTVLALGWLAVTKRRVDREMESARADLLARWQKSAGVVSERSRTLKPRVQGWLQRLSGSYQGDLVSDRVKSNDGLASLLGSSIVYLRGPLAELATSQGSRTSANESVKDSFVLCLLDPPSERTENAILSRVRSAYGAGQRMRTVTRRVERLGTALRGLPILLPDFRDGIALADDRFELERYEQAFEAAPLEATKRALAAPLLLVLIDEPGDPKATTELDGERPHPVRVGLVDLERDRALLRLRRDVDPAWLSAERRSRYARGADDCALALDVHEAVHHS